MTEQTERRADGAAAELNAAREDHALARAYFEKHPGIEDLVGNAAGFARRAWVNQWAVGDEVVRAGLQKTVDALVADLLGPTPSKLERLLATRVGICWLQVHYFDAVEGAGGERSLKSAELGLKRQDRAHRRYLTALKALAEVRRLQAPALQLNIAKQQVNVVGEVNSAGVGGVAKRP